MFAILSSCGKQYRVELGCTIVLDRLEGEVGSVIEMNDILVTGDRDAFNLAKKTSNILVEILEHFKGEKCIIFKKRRRKNYERKNGFRHSHTKVLIKAINA